MLKLIFTYYNYIGPRTSCIQFTLTPLQYWTIHEEHCYSYFLLHNHVYNSKTGIVPQSRDTPNLTEDLLVPLWYWDGVDLRHHFLLQEYAPLETMGWWEELISELCSCTYTKYNYELITNMLHTCACICVQVQYTGNRMAKRVKFLTILHCKWKSNLHACTSPCSMHVYSKIMWFLYHVHVLVNVQCRGVYDSKPPDYEGVSPRGRCGLLS